LSKLFFIPFQSIFSLFTFSIIEYVTLDLDEISRVIKYAHHVSHHMDPYKIGSSLPALKTQDFTLVSKASNHVRPVKWVRTRYIPIQCIFNCVKTINLGKCKVTLQNIPF